MAALDEIQSLMDSNVEVPLYNLPADTRAWLLGLSALPKDKSQGPLHVGKKRLRVEEPSVIAATVLDDTEYLDALDSEYLEALASELGCTSAANASGYGHNPHCEALEEQLPIRKDRLQPYSAGTADVEKEMAVSMMTNLLPVNDECWSVPVRTECLVEKALQQAWAEADAAKLATEDALHRAEMAERALRFAEATEKRHEEWAEEAEGQIQAMWEQWCSLEQDLQKSKVVISAMQRSHEKQQLQLAAAEQSKLEAELIALQARQQRDNMGRQLAVMMTEISEVEAKLDAVTRAENAKPVWSAKVLDSNPLVLGVEALDDDSARGDVTSAYCQALEDASARQAYCIGHMSIEAAVDLDAPAGVHGYSIPASCKFTVSNNGTQIWPKTVALAVLEGEAFGQPLLPLQQLAPGQSMDVEMDLSVLPLSELGTALSSWTIVDAASGICLGPLLLFKVTSC